MAFSVFFAWKKNVAMLKVANNVRSLIKLPTGNVPFFQKKTIQCI